MKVTVQNLAALAFSGLCIALAVAIWVWPAPSAAVNERRPQTAQAVAPEAPLDLEVITTRPLFDRTRKPLELAPEPVATTPKPAAVTLSLKGVIGNADGGLTALLRMSNSDELFTRRAGEEIGTFTIQRIESKRVTLRDRSGKTFVLVLGTE